MGRNGSGKTTLAYALMGHPAYQVTSGEVWWKGINVLDLSADKRARLAPPGVPVPHRGARSVGGLLPAHGSERPLLPPARRRW